MATKKKRTEGGLLPPCMDRLTGHSDTNMTEVRSRMRSGIHGDIMLCSQPALASTLPRNFLLTQSIRCSLPAHVLKYFIVQQTWQQSSNPSHHRQSPFFVCLCALLCLSTTLAQRVPPPAWAVRQNPTIPPPRLLLWPFLHRVGAEAAGRTRQWLLIDG